MCYSKAEGGYRCMPSATALKNYAGKPEKIGKPKTQYKIDTARGAYWEKEDERIPELDELKEDAYGLKTVMFNFSDNPERVEREIMHMGNMITRYSDAQVENFNQRLEDAQIAALVYQRFYTSTGHISSSLYDKAVALNLSLSYDVRSSLRNTLSQIVDFGTPVDIEMNGPSADIENIRAASLYYPSDWNAALQSTINVTAKGYNTGASSWRPLNNEILIASKLQNYMSYASMEDAEKAKLDNFRKYETGTATVHEYAHKLESINPGIFEVCAIYRNRRIAALPLVKHGGFRYGQDHFANPYIGKVYESSVHTEVFSMGMESTFLGTNGALIGLSLPEIEGSKYIKNNRADIEHRNLTVGMLATLSMPFNHDNRDSPIDSVFQLDYNECSNGCKIYCKCKYCNNHEETCPKR